MTLGARLKELRLQSNRKQEEIQKIFTLSAGSYSLYENDKRRPSYETLIKFAQFYNVSTDYLLGLIDTPYHTGERVSIYDKYSPAEVEIFRLIHLMDDEYRRQMADYAQFLFDKYEKDGLRLPERQAKVA